MRDVSAFLERYRELALPGANTLNRFDLRDIALTDLCLHFLHRHAPSESVGLIPPLLQGHLVAALPEEMARALFALRQYAGNLCSRLAWRKALSAHSEARSRTAYIVHTEDKVRPREAVAPDLVGLLDGALLGRLPYTQRELRFADPGHAKVELRHGQEIRTFKIPHLKDSVPDRGVLPKRSVNPPISIKWERLLSVAREVDARETAPGFPEWMPRLNLHSRLSKVKVESISPDFFQNGAITLDGTRHVVGMLSSGKSTLLQALLFTLASPDYGKRVVVLSPDTASASQLVARLHAHGYQQATVISSARNRDEHLSMAHWNAQGYPSDAMLEATAAMTRSLGVACPLEGFQPPPQYSDDPVSRTVLRLSEKPCHRLKQPGKSRSDVQRSCPLIGGCPLHEQQSRLGTANVIAITPQALLHMTVDRAFVAEEMSFPELFQYLADVVLIDEADSVQATYDEECTQEKDLLSPNDSAFMITNMRTVAQSISDRTGRQYLAASNVRWHRELNKLQDSISAIYHLLLKQGDKLRWFTDRKTFTAASILADLVPIMESAEEGRESAARERTKTLEQIAIIAGMLYGKVAAKDDEDTSSDSKESSLSTEMREVYAFLDRHLLMITEAVIEDAQEGAIHQIANAIESGPLSVFSHRGSTSNKRRRISGPFSRPTTPIDSLSRAYAIALAMLTNICLSSFAYLVRNQLAVEDDFGLSEEDAFREARRLLRHYGSIIPRPLFGTVFGLMFSPASESAQGGTLKLVNHLGVGRYLLTQFDKLLAAEGQAGPHVLLMSGTSWAGGQSATASPTFDVQQPVSAILTQPEEELVALSQSRYEFVSLSHEPITVSGTAPDERRETLRRAANLLGRSSATGSWLSNKWHDLEALWTNERERMPNRRRALLVTNNYGDAKIVANELARVAGQAHRVYCLVSDQLVRLGELERDATRSAEEFHRHVVPLPRSRVEDFGRTPQGSILVAPLKPISRGHNIVTEAGYAAISAIYFLHRPHPRPDDHSSVIGMINRLAMNALRKDGLFTSSNKSLDFLARHFVSQAHRALNEGFAMRVAYSIMPEEARTQYSWDLITSLWQTIGRGIRGGVPIYVGFIDKKFAPGVFDNPPKRDTANSSSLRQCQRTLQLAMSDSVDKVVAERLYRPFLDALDRLFDDQQGAEPCLE